MWACGDVIIMIIQGRDLVARLGDAVPIFKPHVSLGKRDTAHFFVLLRLSLLKKNDRLYMYQRLHYYLHHPWFFYQP